MMPAIEVLVDTKEKVELRLKMGDVWHYEGVDAQHRVPLSCLPIKNEQRGPQLPIQVALTHLSKHADFTHTDRAGVKLIDHALEVDY